MRPLFYFLVFSYVTQSIHCFIQLPFWYPVIPTNELLKKDIHNIFFFDDPLVVYKNKYKNYSVHSDICPHQGASLSKGYIGKEGHLHCPYHGFEFNEGQFIGIPCESKHRRPSKIRMPTYQNHLDKDFLYIKPFSNVSDNVPFVYFPPEEYDINYKSVEGSVIVHNNYQSICENLLDMLHISYVHSFGNLKYPLPTDIKGKRLNPYSYRTTFKYRPNDNTISNKWGKVTDVIVENEYHLPTNTVTRVMAGDIIKTVFTRSIPLTKNKTLLYWKVYRNFWIDPYFNIFTLIGNYLIKYLMTLTIQEDINILKNTYESYRNGPLIVKYDITIQNFRRDLDLYKI
jgi:phenylpropionate dioxygenase-like ring-hydroxylating dioxygenase large terminal subunit